MLWQDLKRAVPCSQTHQYGYTKAVLQRRVEQNSTTAMSETDLQLSEVWLQLLLLKAQLVIKFRG
ncbi:hypothetical protein LDENG_00106250 [Lucifuga dentata]|nr:hypothetical protein LDENG_00106250 [Lucifuga dentata]